MMNIKKHQIKELEFAKSLGVIESTSEDYLRERMEEYNLKAKESSFGKTLYNEISFPSYLIAKFRMDFVFENLNYDYKPITKDDIQKFYEDNKSIFLRENKEYFGLEEMNRVIVKRLREIEYEEIVDGLLR